MALYEPAQHLLKLSVPINGITYMRSTTRVWIGPSESISLHTKETNDDATVSAIVYEVIQDDEESAPQEVKLKQNVPYKEKVSQKVLVKIIRIINGTVIPLGSTSNNSDDADIDKKNADG